ncbi:MAG: prepilin-type N-terminal cleavage/methylation domain-containing protein, partial [Phycisphaerae bacterium]|nr:prepilin-type N-terminal cleavage/methylation domain-containing protein [Phycisphaerae bacterium]
MIPRTRQPAARGLTIIEVLVVCILIALLAGLV